jgi:hypothetical protein
MGENAGNCGDCTTTSTCGDGTCAMDGSENGWCYDQYNQMMYTYDICGGYCGDGVCQTTESSMICSSDCGVPTSACGDGICAMDGSEDGWCSEWDTMTASNVTCAINSTGYCGDGVCDATGSENGSCYDQWNSSTSMWEMCGGVVNQCGDGICATDGSENGWCWDQNNFSELCGYTANATFAPTLNSVSISADSLNAMVDVSAQSPDGLGYGVYYVSVNLYDSTNMTYYGSSSYTDYMFPVALFASMSFSHYGIMGDTFYPYVYICDWSDCTTYYSNSAISTTNYTYYNTDTGYVDTDSGLPIPYVTVP